jgi:hypothetical protein
MELRMSKAVAVAITGTKSNPFQLALESVKNTTKFIGDTLYGTEERVRRTILLAFFAAVLGAVMNNAAAQAAACASNAFGF